MKSTKYPHRPPPDPNHPSRFQRAKNALHLRRKNKGVKGAGENDSMRSNTATTEAQSTVRSTTAFTATSATVENGSMLTPVDNAEATQRRAQGDDAGPVGQDLEGGGEADADYEEEEEVPQLTAGVALGLLMVVTVVRFPFLLLCNVGSEGILGGYPCSFFQLVAVTAEFLVSSIDGLTATGHISEAWVGLILLPIVGNAAEHATAVTVSYKDKLDLSIGVAVGSSIQIALFVIPLLVLLGWIMGKPLTMLFDPFESIVLFLSVLTVAFCINDGRSNWLEGMILMSVFSVLMPSFFVFVNGGSVLGLYVILVCALLSHPGGKNGCFCRKSAKNKTQTVQIEYRSDYLNPVSCRF